MKIFRLALLLASLAFAAETTPGWVPSSETAVATATVRLYRLHLSNTTGGAVTVIIKDRSTNCSAGACQLWPTVSVAANSVQVADLGGVLATSGLTWQASAGTSIVGWMTYGNP